VNSGADGILPAPGDLARKGSHVMSATRWESKPTLPGSKNRDHVRGSADARVTLVEYGDFECPYSGKAYPIVKHVRERMGEQLRFIFRNFPLTTLHPHAERAAEAAEAAAAQGRFWEMHDLLYENQRHLLDDDLRSYAQALDLDLDLFDEELADHVYADRIHEDLMSGVRSGVNGTPTFFINGLRHEDSYEFEALLLSLQRAAENGAGA
jgi:protein-disulfide isomerase